MTSDKLEPGVPSLLSSGLRIIGTIVSDGEIQLDGSVEGDVYCTSLVVGQDAHIKGDVVARNVVVRGQVEGLIRAREVTLPNSARVDGGIVSRLISVEMGAMLNGNCQYSDDPLAGETTPSARPAPAARPAPPAYSPPPFSPPPIAEPLISTEPIVNDEVAVEEALLPPALAEPSPAKLGADLLPTWLQGRKAAKVKTDDAGKTSPEEAAPLIDEEAKADS